MKVMVENLKSAEYRKNLMFEIAGELLMFIAGLIIAYYLKVYIF